MAPKSTVTVDLERYQAWWTGNPDQLTATHTTPNSGINQGPVWRNLFTKSSTRSPGVNQPVTKQEHVPLAAIIVRKSAALLFGEDLTYQWDQNTDTTRATQVIEKSGLPERLLEGGETCAALGGVFYKIGWNTTTNPTPYITVVSPLDAQPVFTESGELTQVTFIKTLAPNKKPGVTLFYQHRETHQPGVIRHELWEATTPDFTDAKPVPLTDHPYTKQYAVYTDNGTGVTPTGHTNGLTAFYMPNLRPQPGSWVYDPVGKHYGRSDLQACEPLLQSADQIQTGLMRDHRHGQSKVFYPAPLTLENTPGGGAFIDLDQEVFVGVPTASNADDQRFEVTTVQPNIRVDVFLTSLKDVERRCYQAAGYSPATFGLDTDGPAVTATEVTARTRETMATRATKIRYATPVIETIVEALTMVDAFVYGGAPAGRPVVVFPPAVAPTPQETADYVATLANAGLASVKTVVKALHPDWDDTMVDVEVDAIRGERGTVVDPLTL